MGAMVNWRTFNSALTITTAGLGTVIAGAMGGGLLASIAGGAIASAAIGVVTGALKGGFVVGLFCGIQYRLSAGKIANDLSIYI